MVKDSVPLLCGKVGTVEPDSELICYRLRISQILFGRAVFGAIVFLPVFHEQALDSIARVDQQHRGHRGIDASGHADDNGLIELEWRAH